ncbi:MAG: hypothetical protein HYS07_03030 [Chlamydiae bacterium]|nr:hypothetical protein [Chlamydiota bacterium]MBI3277185.1 hypothetical protein [Chlamydiota bacterium]
MMNGFQYETKNLEVSGKEFEYIHIRKDLFWGYERQKGFLIASPEKALADQIYLVSKGLRKLDFDELDRSCFNLRYFKKVAAKISYAPFQKWVQKLC